MADISALFESVALRFPYPKASADATPIDSLSVPVMAALGLEYDWLKSDFPAAGSFVSIGSLAGK